MLQSDTEAQKMRPYLVASQRLVDQMAAAFKLFDQDGSGSIGVEEFQQILFDLGELVTLEQVNKQMHSKGDTWPGLEREREREAQNPPGSLSQIQPKLYTRASRE